MTASRENVSFFIHLFQLTIVNPFPYTLPIKNQRFLVLMEMYFLKYLISIFFFVNLHKISNTFLCNIFIDISGVLRIIKAYRALKVNAENVDTVS